MKEASHQPSSRWSGRSQCGAAGYRAFLALIRFFGPVPAYGLLFFVAAWYALTDRCSSQWIRDFRRRLGFTTTRFDLFRHYFSFGMSLIDRFAFLMRKRTPFRYTCMGEDVIRRVVSSGRGAVLVGAHMGNWELAGNLLADHLGATVNIVVYDNEKEEVKRVFSRAMQARRVRVIETGKDTVGAAILIIKALREGQIVCLHGDRQIDQRSERVEFLGGPARFPVGPYALGAIAACPIIPVFAIKTGLRSYSFHVFEPICIGDMPRGERDNALRAAVTRFVEILEQMVRRYVWEWHNYYPFWEDSESSATLLQESTAGTGFRRQTA